MKGNAEYEVARRLLRAILTVRDAIRIYRSPFTHPSELVARKREEDEQPGEASVLDEEFAHRNRLMEVHKARSDLRIAALEAEVLWGQSVHQSLESLNKRIGELFVAHDWYFREQLNAARKRPVLGAIVETNHRIIYGSLALEDDYAKSLDAAVASAEEAFRVHLK